MRLHGPIDVRLYPAEEVMREALVRLEIARLEGHCYLALLAALVRGKLDDAESYRCGCGRLMVPRRVTHNGRTQTVWQDSSLPMEPEKSQPKVRLVKKNETMRAQMRRVQQRKGAL